MSSVDARKVPESQVPVAASTVESQRVCREMWRALQPDNFQNVAASYWQELQLIERAESSGSFLIIASTQMLSMADQVETVGLGAVGIEEGYDFLLVAIVALPPKETSSLHYPLALCIMSDKEKLTVRAAIRHWVSTVQMQLRQMWTPGAVVIGNDDCIREAVSREWPESKLCLNKVVMKKELERWFCDLSEAENKWMRPIPENVEKVSEMIRCWSNNPTEPNGFDVLSGRIVQIETLEATEAKAVISFLKERYVTGCDWTYAENHGDVMTEFLNDLIISIGRELPAGGAANGTKVSEVLPVIFNHVIPSFNKTLEQLKAAAEDIDEDWCTLDMPLNPPFITPPPESHIEDLPFEVITSRIEDIPKWFEQVAALENCERLGRKLHKGAKSNIQSLRIPLATKFGGVYFDLSQISTSDRTSDATLWGEKFCCKGLNTCRRACGGIGECARGCNDKDLAHRCSAGVTIVIRFGNPELAVITVYGSHDGPLTDPNMQSESPPWSLASSRSSIATTEYQPDSEFAINSSYMERVCSGIKRSIGDDDEWSSEDEGPQNVITHMTSRNVKHRLNNQPTKMPKCNGEYGLGKTLHMTSIDGQASKLKPRVDGSHLRPCCQVKALKIQMKSEDNDDDKWVSIDKEGNELAVVEEVNEETFEVV